MLNDIKLIIAGRLESFEEKNGTNGPFLVGRISVFQGRERGFTNFDCGFSQTAASFVMNYCEPGDNVLIESPTVEARAFAKNDGQPGCVLRIYVTQIKKGYRERDDAGDGQQRGASQGNGQRPANQAQQRPEPQRQAQERPRHEGNAGQRQQQASYQRSGPPPARSETRQQRPAPPQDDPPYDTYSDSVSF